MVGRRWSRRRGARAKLVPSGQHLIGTPRGGRSTRRVTITLILITNHDFEDIILKSSSPPQLTRVRLH